MSTIWRDGDHDMITTGKSDRKVTEVVLYDEAGPLITNYTNLNDYEFETTRNISIRAIDEPDWTNPDGFLIREHASYNARYEGGAWYVLFVHVDNVPSYAREFLDYWELYEIDPGAIRCTFSLEGCTFLRIVGNPAIMHAENVVRWTAEKFNGNGWMQGGFLNNASTICDDPDRALTVYQEMAHVVRDYKEIRDLVLANNGICDLIHTNRANKPIGYTDYNNPLTHYGLVEVDDE